LIVFVFPISALVNCQWSNWSAWESCSKSCGGGTQTSTRSKTVQETNGGTCSGSSERSKSCNSQSCPAGQGPGEFSSTLIYNLPSMVLQTRLKISQFTWPRENCL